MIESERAGRKVGVIHTVVVDAIWLGPEQRIVSIIDQGDRETRTEMCNPGELPSLRPAVCGAEDTFRGNFVVVARDEVVLDVKRRKSIAQRRVDGIDLLSDVGGLIDGFAEGVAA